MIIIVIQSIFSSIKSFWAPLGAHSNPRLAALAKISQGRALYIFVPAYINFIVILSKKKNQNRELFFIRFFFLPIQKFWTQSVRKYILSEDS